MYQHTDHRTWSILLVRDGTGSRMYMLSPYEHMVSTYLALARDIRSEAFGTNQETPAAFLGSNATFPSKMPDPTPYAFGISAATPERPRETACYYCQPHSLVILTLDTHSIAMPEDGARLSAQLLWRNPSCLLPLSCCGCFPFTTGGPEGTVTMSFSHLEGRLERDAFPRYSSLNVQD